jgi:hypothetical protein
MVRLGGIRAMAERRHCGEKEAAAANRPAETRRQMDFAPKVTHTLRKNHELQSLRQHGTNVDDAAPEDCGRQNSSSLKDQLTF